MSSRVYEDLKYKEIMVNKGLFNVVGERQKFCVHGIIGARQSGASNEHEYQTQFS